MRAIFYFSLLILTACTSVINDSSVYIKGFVLDVNGSPVQGVDVTFSGSRTETSDKGCFYFGGLHDLDKIELSLSSKGYRDYFISTSFENVLLNITLVKKNSALRNEYSGITVDGKWASNNRGCGT